jgi:phosphatidylinositol glycan class U
MYATILGPLFFNLWIYASSGNANFFYAITLLWGLSQVMLLMDVASGFARREWEKRNPGWRISRVESVLK